MHIYRSSSPSARAGVLCQLVMAITVACSCSGEGSRSPDGAPATDATADQRRLDAGSDAGIDVGPEADAAWPDAGAASWGAKCQKDSECLSGFECKSGKTDLYGFCTRSCKKAGSPCQFEDLPAGTKSFCALLVQSTYYCGFLCKMKTVTYPCPTGMTCGTKETPPGTQQYWCAAQ